MSIRSTTISTTDEVSGLVESAWAALSGLLPVRFPGRLNHGHLSGRLQRPMRVHPDEQRAIAT